MKNFFDNIIYSSSNEDGNSELRALQINQSDTILAITGSWSRSLDLLIQSPKKVISIDFNKTQNYLLRLKIAGYSYLNYEDFISLMWVYISTHSLSIFERIKDKLDLETRTYFEDNEYLLKRGIIYSWVWEKINISFSKLFFCKKSKIEKLFDSKTIKEQENYWKQEFDTWLLRWLIKIMTNRFLWVHIIREPWARLIKRDFDVAHYMLNKLQHLIRISLLKENDFANLIFLWKYKYSLPIHLQKEYFEKIKQNIDRIEIVDGYILDYVKDISKTKEITWYSLSDFCSYAEDDFYASVWENIVKNSINGTKFCERQFLVKQNPEKLFTEIKRNPLLEQEIGKTDKTFIYTFCIWIITKN